MAASSVVCAYHLQLLLFNNEHPMRSYPEHHIVTTASKLDSLFDQVAPASYLKEVSFVHPHYRALIEASPFAVLATSGPNGLDASPRGDLPGFVVVEDEKTLLLPERRGNNRADSLHNIISDPRVALLFLIPGVGETLRVNGKASIVVAPELLTRFAVDGREPKCVISIEVEAVFFQCARAILRSRLWESAPADRRASTIPSAGAILAALSEGQIDGKAYDHALPARQLSTLY
jgi:PPOX class probable FMN-dependent enzyme